MHFKEKLLGFIAFLIYRLYSWSFRYRVHYASEESKRLIDEDMKMRRAHPTQNFIYAFWHQDEMALIPKFAGKNIGVLVSHSKDGTILATALELLGYQTVRGSSSKKAVAGFLSSLRLLTQGHKLALAIDGPRGPIYQAKEGVIRLSQKSSRPIVPVKSFPQRFYLFAKAWSKNRLPLPFSRVDVVFGAPSMYQKEELEAALEQLKVN